MFIEVDRQLSSKISVNIEHIVLISENYIKTSGLVVGEHIDTSETYNELKEKIDKESSFLLDFQEIFYL